LRALAPAREYDFENNRIIRTPSRAVYIPPHTNIPHRVHVPPPEHHIIDIPPPDIPRPEHHIIDIPNREALYFHTPEPPHIPPPHIPPPVQAHGTAHAQAPAQSPVQTTQTIETQTQTAPYGFTIVDKKG